MPQPPSTCLEVSLKKGRWVGGVGAATFGLLTFSGWYHGQVMVLSVGLIFFLISGYALIQSGRIRFSQADIELTTIMGRRYRLGWAEIDRVESGLNHSQIVFFSGSRALPIPDSGWWSGENEIALSLAIDDMLKANGISIVQTIRADFYFPIGTRH